ncbi:MAG: DUF4974 domain-containing protein [Tannerella sp.]|jgi:ferric-dicitrate binding protein FerR (iron transport regulator)|nr:DUF4974 domain-containing protein [Tannerella sp.]
MNNHAHTTLLIQKLLDDKLPPEELQELQRLFASAEAEGEIELWLTDLWKSAEGQNEISIDPEQIRKRLDEKTGHTGREKRLPAKDETAGAVRFLRAFMRYAAVFVVAIVLSWYWFRSEDTPEAKIPPVFIAQANGINEVSVTYGSKTRIVLPDSSVVFLNSGSKLSYPSVFDRERSVTLTGEGYFIVRSDSLHPFLVHASDVSIKALGTEFNVKAYPEEQRIETVLVNGSVEILKKDQINPIVELNPGEKATYTKSAPAQPVTETAKEHARMIVGTEPKPDVSTGWVENRLVFDAEPFEQIAVRLERWFNVKIEIHNAGLRKARLSGRYDTENIEQVIHSLQMTTPFIYKIEKNKIVFK